MNNFLLSSTTLKIINGPSFYRHYSGETICMIEGDVGASIHLNPNFHEAAEMDHGTYRIPIRLKEPAMVYYALKKCRPNETFLFKGHMWIDKFDLCNSKNGGTCAFNHRVRKGKANAGLLMDCLLIGDPLCFNTFGDMITNWNQVKTSSLGIARFDMSFQNVFRIKLNKELESSGTLIMGSTRVSGIPTTDDFKWVHTGKKQGLESLNDEESMVYDNAESYFNSNGNMETLKAFVDGKCSRQ